MRALAFALLCAAAASAAPADTARPALLVLPAAQAPGSQASSAELESVEEALRLGITLSGRYRLLSREETAPRFGGAERIPRACFTAMCVSRAGRRSGASRALGAQLFRPASDDSLMTLALALVDTASGRVDAALLASARADSAPLLPFAQAAVLRLLAADSAAPPVPATFDTASGPWGKIPWLNRRGGSDYRRRWTWAGAGVLAAGALLAYAEGQLLQEDANTRAPGTPTLDGDGAYSFLRGFFAAPTLGAQYAAMGGAGIAQVDNALAVLFNPAGVAEVGAGTGRESAVAAKRSLPGGAPSFFVAYAGPLWGAWSQGLGVQYEGDGLANETTLHGDLAFDWSALGASWSWLKTGAGLKLYLAKVGEEGSGYERSTGHSFGMGLDLGARVRLSDRISAAFAVRDAFGFLRHDNTFTNETYGEILPPEYRVGAAYRVSPHLLLVMDGQKAMWADQADHVRLGVEKVAFGFLALRGGLHEIFGREEVRKGSLGFGIDTEGFGDNPLHQKLALDYAYEFGIDENEPLGGGQQFSLEVSF